MGNDSKKLVGVIVLFVLFYCAFLIFGLHLWEKKNNSVSSSQTQLPNQSQQFLNSSTSSTTPSSTTTASAETNIVPKPSTPPKANTPSQSPDDLLKNMHLTFDDEFSSFSRYVDSAGNTTCNGGGSGTWQTVYAFCSRTISTNYEAEVYVDPSFISYYNSTHQTPTQTINPLSVNNGVLNIEAAPIDPNVAAAVGSAEIHFRPYYQPIFLYANLRLF